ncbi:MAG: hypothetical protein Q9220_003604 [cf. Caloplaca sp. 1 TL-2023]
MATDFIGCVVTVTLNTPPKTQIQGLVNGIVEGSTLLLKDVTWLSSGNQQALLHVEASNIQDLNIEPNTKPSPAKPDLDQSLPDPAILSYDRSVKDAPTRTPPAPPPPLITVSTQAPVVEPSIVTETKPLELIAATATLTEPFTELTLDDAVLDGLDHEQEADVGAKATTKKTRKRRPPRTRREKQPPEHTGALQTPNRADGWGEPPFLQETPIGKKPHPLDAPIRRAEQRLSQARKARAHRSTEEPNGWATEEATDIQDMGEFDFQGNLSKFDKHGVFEQLRQDDTTADEERLVSFNRLPARPGTNGGRNLHFTENVLDSPKQNGRPDWSEKADSEDSDGLFGSFRSSPRALSRASIRKPPSRKGSALIHNNDQTSSSGFPHRYSSQEHPSPHIKVKPTASRYPRSESSRASKPSYQMASTGNLCPSVTPLQMLELEQLATSELGFSEDMLTENAARCIAQLALQVTNGERIVILAGNTKTGARAIAAGRQLRNHGIRVLLLVLGNERDDDLLDVVRRQLNIYRNAGGRTMQVDALTGLVKNKRRDPADLIVDAMLGIHLSVEDLRTAEHNAYCEIVTWVHGCDTPVLTVDVPSGLDAAGGIPPIPDLLIEPTYLLFLGAPKAGLLTYLSESANRQIHSVSKLFVADIGISNAAWKKFGTRRKYGVEFGREWVAELRFEKGG